LPEKAVCWTDEMCSIGSCRENDNGEKQGYCGKAPNSEKCERDLNCLSKFCGYKSVSAKEMTCCAVGNIAVKDEDGEHMYCTGHSLEDECLVNEMCASGKCEKPADSKTGKCAQLNG
jgi:hypothetical protein